MKPAPIRTSLVVVALGDTDPIEAALKTVGFKWNPENKVWYVIDEFTEAQHEFCRDVREARHSLGVWFRVFKLRGDDWSEIRW